MFLIRFLITVSTVVAQDHFLSSGLYNTLNLPSDCSRSSYPACDSSWDISMRRPVAGLLRRIPQGQTTNTQQMCMHAYPERVVGILGVPEARLICS